MALPMALGERRGSGGCGLMLWRARPRLTTTVVSFGLASHRPLEAQLFFEDLRFGFGLGRPSLERRACGARVPFSGKPPLARPSMTSVYFARP